MAEFTSQELDEYRDEILDYLVDDFIIHNVITVTDNVGGQTEVKTDTNVKGLIGPTGTAKELQIANALQVTSPYTITLPFGTVLDENDTIEHVQTGRQYEINSVMSDYSYQIAVTVLVSRKSA